MSVSKMKRLAVYAYKSELDGIVKKLMRLRCVEISTYGDPSESEELSLQRISCDGRRLELEARLSDIDSAILTLEPYVKKKKGLFVGKTQLDVDEFVEKGYADKARKILARTEEIAARRNQIKNESGKALSEISAARPYLAFDLPLGFSGTDTTDCFLGVLPVSTDLGATGKETYAAGAVVNVLGKDKNGVYVSFFCHKADSAAVASLLSSYGFLRAAFAGVDMTAREYCRAAQKRQRELAAEDEALDEELRALASDGVGLLEVLYDIEATELEATNQKLKFAATDTVAIIKAWIPAGREEIVKGALDKFECAYETSDPSDEEIPPILLKNNGFATNFEWVLGMYSYPLYGKFDPTLIMSIFYFLIFGIMFADVGYGLVMVLACFIAPKIFKLSKGLERSMKMFGYCGISSIFFGVLFGSYFGDLPIAFMQNMLGIPADKLPNLALIRGEAATLALIFDPLQNPMGFLIFGLAVGAIHLFAGMAVNFVLLCKDGKVLDAIFDIGAYWLLFLGIGLLLIVPSVGMWVAIAGVALIVLTHGRKEKNIIMKLLKGLLGLYDLINYASDLLSYSRILALGLAAGIIAQVVNILGTMGGPSVFGIIIFILVFIIGHLLNLAINVLGTFVHTSRLQYIEFFGKFYEDGGVQFEPVTASEKFTEHQDS